MEWVLIIFSFFNTQLQPYVSVHTPMIEQEVRLKIKDLNNFRDPQNLDRSNQKPLSIDTVLQENLLLQGGEENG